MFKYIAEDYVSFDLILPELIVHLQDVKCSGNWMWPAKLHGEGANLVDACKAMCKVMEKLGIAVDGGKDSLSMAARVGDNTVKAPGLFLSNWAGLKLGIISSSIFQLSHSTSIAEDHQELESTGPFSLFAGNFVKGIGHW
jgi:hypothetical protein